MPRFLRPRRRAVSLVVGAVAAAGVIWGALNGASLTGTPAVAQVGPTPKPTPTAAPTASPAPTPTSVPKPTATPTPTPTPPAPGSNALYNLAWNLPPASGDTGHVMVVAGKPVQIAPVDGNATYSVLVFDSSSIRHYNDTRGPQGGVGSGEIHFQVNAAGQPIRFQFGPGDLWNATQIAIGRLTPSALAGASVRNR